VARTLLVPSRLHLRLSDGDSRLPGSPAALQDAGVEVIGASTDSFFSHKHWFADGKTFPEKITHPVVADTNHTMSRAFGVLKEDQGVAFRATVVVDDAGLIRSMSVNDLSAGRSPAEVLRTVEALQSGGLCPADWRSGQAFAS